VVDKSITAEINKLEIEQALYDALINSNSWSCKAEKRQ